MEYYVLKQGRTEGPFTQREIVTQLAGGRFTLEDLGQADGVPYWTPLRRIVDRAASANDETELEAEDRIAAPPALPQGFTSETLHWWKTTSAGVQHLLQRYPYETGLAFLGIGCALLLLSYVSIFIFGPVLVGALLGGGITMLRGRVFAGLGLCAAAVFIPALLWSAFFWVGRVLSLH